MTCLLHPKILLYPSSSFSVFLAVVITNKSPSSIFNHLRVINFISFKRSDDCLFQVSFLHVQLFICNLFYKVFTSCIWQLMLETSKQIKKQQKTLHVLTIAMICFMLALLWKCQYFWRPIHIPIEHLWWSFYCENSKPLNIFTKKLQRRCSLGF